MHHESGETGEFHKTFRSLVRESRGSPGLLLGLGAMFVFTWIFALLLTETIPTIAKVTKTLTKQPTKALSRLLNFFSTHETTYNTTLHHILQIKLLHYSYLLSLLLLPLLYKASHLLLQYLHQLH
jgi:hypothetical protein